MQILLQDGRHMQNLLCFRAGMDHKTYYDLEWGSEIYYASEPDALWNLLWYGMQPKIYYDLELFQKKYKFQSSLPKITLSLADLCLFGSDNILDQVRLYIYLY
jgi:hypothetical protein